MFFKKTYPIGIDISDYSIEVLQLNKKREILAYGRIILEEGIVEDGKILAKKKLAEKIKEVLSKTVPHSLALPVNCKAIASLPESKVFIHYFEVLPDLEGQALARKVFEEAGKIVPMEQDLMCWDFMSARHGFSPATKKERDDASEEPVKSHKDILFVGTSKELVRNLREVFALAGLELIALDIESISLGRALLSLPDTKSWLDALENEARQRVSTMIIDIGARTTTISIFDSNQILVMSVNIPIAGERFTRAIQEKLGVTVKEAEELKRKFGFDSLRGENRVFPILQAELQGVLRELKTVIQYHERKRSEHIAKIILAGGSALVPSIDEYIAANTEKEVVLANPLEKVKDGNIFGEKISPLLFADVIGLALRGISKNPEDEGINLLPEGERGFIVKSAKKLSAISPLPKTKKQEERGAVAPKKKKIFSHIAYRSLLIPVFVLGSVSLVVLGYLILKPKTYDVVAPSSSIEEKTQEGEMGPKEGENELSTDTQLPSGDKESIIKKESVVVVIGATPTGWLRVRGGPATTFVEVAKVNPGEKYEFLEESSGWYKIQLDEKRTGWIFSTYAKKSNAE